MNQSPKRKQFSKHVVPLRTDFYSFDLGNFRTRVFSPVADLERTTLSRLKSPDVEKIKLKRHEVVKLRRTQVLLRELNTQLKTKESQMPEAQVRTMSAASEELQGVLSIAVREGAALKGLCRSYAFESQFIKSRVDKCLDSIEHSKLNQVKLVSPRQLSEMLKNQNEVVKQAKEQVKHIEMKFQQSQHKCLELAWQVSAKQLQVTVLSKESRQRMSLPELYQAVSELNMKLANSQSRVNKFEKMLSNKSVAL